MRHASAPSRLGIIGACLVALTGCGGSQDSDVEAVAGRFYEAVRAQDGEAACALLAPKTRSEVEQSSGTRCADGLLEEAIPAVAAQAEVKALMGRWMRSPRPAYAAYQRKLSQDADDKLLADLKAKGVQVTTVDTAAFAKATASVYDKWLATPISPYLKKLIAETR